VNSTGHAVVVFDGECAFCNRWVDFLLRFDRTDTFRFTARQSQSGAAFSWEVEGKTIRLRSEALLRMLELLGLPFSLVGIFRVIPVSLRDAVYDTIARNRTRWFRRMSTCRAPMHAEQHRFI
jgi:predicted DCC family thiol-disulfide oxidoreductase YuxK